MKTFQLSITKVDGPVFDGLVQSVNLPGVDGEMTILAHHVALISPLRPGVLTVVKEDGSKAEFAVSSGTLEVSDNQATVLL